MTTGRRVSGFAARLAIIAGFAAVLRAVVLGRRWGRELLMNDSFYYSGQARQLAGGEWFREILVDQPGAEHGPLLPIVLAPVSWMDDYVSWQRLVTALIGVAVVVAIGILGRRIGGDRVGLVAAGIAAVYPNLWMSDGLVMSESLAALLVALVLIGLGSTIDRPGTAPALGFGVAVGLAALTRSELLLIAPLGALVMWRWQTGWRVIAVGLAATAVTIAPWVVFNLSRFEEPVMLTTNDGTTLLGAYCDATFDGPSRGGWFIGCVADHPSYAIAEPSVRSAEQRRAALSYARDNLDRLPAIVGLRLGRMLDLYGLADMEGNDVREERPRTGVRIGVGMFWVLAIAAVAAVPRIRPVDRWVLVLPVITTTVVAIVFYGAHRLRIPLEPVIVVAAAVSLTALASRSGRWWRSVVDRRRRAAHTPRP